MRSRNFQAIDRYDDLLSGFEGEDLDIYMRLRNLRASHSLAVVPNL
jgi:hypothetical protein